MKNYFYDLPVDLQRYIYEFDSTYHNLYRALLPQLRRYRVFEYVYEENLYLVYDKWTQFMWKTNSLETPHWIICYHYPPIDFLSKEIENEIISEIEYSGKNFILPYEELVDSQHRRQIGGDFLLL